MANSPTDSSDPFKLAAYPAFLSLHYSKATWHCFAALVTAQMLQRVRLCSIRIRYDADNTSAIVGLVSSIWLLPGSQLIHVEASSSRDTSHSVAGYVLASSVVCIGKLVLLELSHFLVLVPAQPLVCVVLIVL